MPFDKPSTVCSVFHPKAKAAGLRCDSPRRDEPPNKFPMKNGVIQALAAMLLASLGPLHAQNAAAGDPAAELTTWVGHVQAKVRAGKTGAAELAAEVAEFEALRAKAAALKPEMAAKILQLGYTFQRDVVKDEKAALALRKELESKYRKQLAGTTLGQQFAADDRNAEVKEGQAKLIGKKAPELNFMWSSKEKIDRLSSLKGKVVVLDFWATWCGPCIATFPQIRELVAHYKGADVVVLGVTSLQGYVSGLGSERIITRDDPDQEYALTAKFIHAREMTWPVVFSEERVFNPQYGVKGIPHMAIIAPDGTVRHNGLHPGMPHAQKLKLIDDILKEFGKSPAPRAGSQ